MYLDDIEARLEHTSESQLQTSEETVAQQDSPEASRILFPDKNSEQLHARISKSRLVDIGK